ncbi:MAG: EthD family reductase [Ilumatobacteraceae bacterium]
MNRVTILYPTTEGAKFDLDYYCNSHMPLFAKSLGEHCKGWGVDKVVNGPYEAIGWALVDGLDGFNAAMKEHGAEIMGDVANYTTIQPTLVIGEVAV